MKIMVGIDSHVPLHFCTCRIEVN